MRLHTVGRARSPRRCPMPKTRPNVGPSCAALAPSSPMRLHQDSVFMTACPRVAFAAGSVGHCAPDLRCTARHCATRRCPARYLHPLPADGAVTARTLLHAPTPPIPRPLGARVEGLFHCSAANLAHRAGPQRIRHWARGDDNRHLRTPSASAFSRQRSPSYYRCRQRFSATPRGEWKDGHKHERKSGCWRHWPRLNGRRRGEIAATRRISDACVRRSAGVGAGVG